ncbi:MAG: molybdate ABC transporter substrate-binding protein, partial [Oscillospiraceae bacterium]|nr:molybdate ABC transporter substrate-binding protein [Oscillospiraceae bacterium]
TEPPTTQPQTTATTEPPTTQPETTATTEPPTTQAETTASVTPEQTATEAEPPVDEAPIELIVFAAASMTETLEEISTLYANVVPNVTLVFNFDSSGTLKTQIQEGAECDVFISAGIRQVDQLDISASEEVNTENLDFILQGSRLDLLENKIALVVPNGNPKGINNFDELAAALSAGDILMAMGNSDVPVGQYTQNILKFYSLDEDALANSGVISYGSNVKEVTTQVIEASVDCGVVYSTDAFSAGLDAVDYATLEMCGQVIYPAAVLNVSQHQDAALVFLDYLSGVEAMTVFENVGFAPAQ